MIKYTIRLENLAFEDNAVIIVRKQTFTVYGTCIMYVFYHNSMTT